jgi:prepilin peptidase CpaA
MIGFGWVFFGVLVALLLVAAYIDYRTFKIPKTVVFAILGSGLLANLIRGIWMGIQGRGIFLFTESNVWLGILDGLLFSLVGFLVAFVLLFILWILKTCGGGDVKLMAALGAWLGPVLVVYVWLGSVGFLVMIGIGSLAAALLSGKSLPLPKKGASSSPPKKPRWRISYSLPVALATIVVLLWTCRVELGLAAPDPTPENKVAHHGK